MHITISVLTALSVLMVFAECILVCIIINGPGSPKNVAVLTHQFTCDLPSMFVSVSYCCSSKWPVLDYNKAFSAYKPK